MTNPISALPIEERKAEIDRLVAAVIAVAAQGAKASGEERDRYERLYMNLTHALYRAAGLE
jgi:hypothetical protein